MFYAMQVVDGQAHAMGGRGLLQACQELPELSPGVRCRVGGAVVTPATGGLRKSFSRVVHTARSSGTLGGMTEARSSVVASGFFDPFSPAEAAARDAIDAIVSKGGKILYDAYMERRSFPFAVETTSQQLVAELRMCYVQCDPGEDRPQPRRPPAPPELDHTDAGETDGRTTTDGLAMELDGWALEPEPARVRIDTWARAVVPVRKRIVPSASARQESADQPKTGRRQNASNAGVGGSRPSSRGATLTDRRSMATREVAASPTRAAPASPASAGGERRDSSATRQPIPIQCDQEEDEEEMHIREMKERETNRKAADDVRVKRKVAEESEEAARMAQVQDQMKSKPFTYDSSGNIVWIQPVEVNKLPNPNQPLGFSVKLDKHHHEASVHQSRTTSTSPHTTTPRADSFKKKTRSSKSFTDTYKKNVTVQPSVFENIVMSPGVELSNRSGKHKGKSSGREPGQPMSRKEYEDMTKREARDSGLPGPEGYPEATERGRAPPPSAAAAFPVAAMAQDMVGSAAPGARPEDAHAAQEVPKVPKVPMVARPPETPRPQQPAPPPSFRRLGHLGAKSARERLPTSRGSRFPNCPPPPPLGATMGHGLVKSANEDFYFPPGEDRAASLSARDARGPELGPLSARTKGATPTATPRAPGPQGGSISSKRPDFLERHFPSQ